MSKNTKQWRYLEHTVTVGKAMGALTAGVVEVSKVFFLGKSAKKLVTPDLVTHSKK